MDSSPPEHNHRSVTVKLLAKSISGKSCPICLCHVEDRRAAVIIPCTHAYCIECIRRWSNLKRKCPLCNADFDSWFFKINLSSRTFRREKISPPPDEGKNVISSYVYARPGGRAAEQLRSIRRYRGELNASSSSRTRQLPWRRSFSRQATRDEDPNVVAERVLRWRASIYEQRLQAVPISSSNCLMQRMKGNVDVKRRVLQKIEPWIRRELHAILRDPDPSVIVHVITSIFISKYEEICEHPLGQQGLEHDFLATLRPFLHERTHIFWHELRCFAESSFSMETYDDVVEYTKLLD